MAAKLEAKKNLSVFEQIRQTDENGNEYWTARQLAKVLDYNDFRNFSSVVEKAIVACKNSGQLPKDHVVEINEMVSIGSGAERKMPSYKLSRYACYLIVQNADPAKEVAALGQTYFAVQTRIEEIQQMLAAAAKDAGVQDGLDYAIFQNHGYKGLYGGIDAQGIHKKKNLKKSQHILDHMGSTELAANLFRATQTEEKLRKENVKGKQKANQLHYEVGAKVRQTIKEIGGTMPENLPSAESIKTVQKKLEKESVKNISQKKK